MPLFTELTYENARAYAVALAAIFSRRVAGEGVFDAFDSTYVFPLDDGTTAHVWLECGYVYGEA